MGAGARWLTCAVILGSLAGCGGDEGRGPDAPPGRIETDNPNSLEPAPVIIVEPEPEPEPMAFQPAFHQALRWSHSQGSLTTFRLRVPVGRSGARLRLSFRAGDGPLALQRASVAKAGPDGSLASEPVRVTFGGSHGFTAEARERKTSDAVPFETRAGDELAVSFEALGALAISSIDAFPGSYAREGAYAMSKGALGGVSWPRAVGLATVDVEGPRGRAFVALGDSITEGYISGRDDTRKAWPSLLQAELGVPVVNAGVSGQGLYDGLRFLSAEVLALEGLTDCIVLLGTNDLGAPESGATIEQRLAELFSRLEGRCRVWAGTLLPRERSSSDIELVKRRRVEVNAWIRTQADVVGVIDFESVTRSPTDVHEFIDAYDQDGIHPSRAGHAVMAEEAARVLAE